MASISIETKRIDELAEAAAVGSENDLLLLRHADGTGTKSIKLSALKKAIAGDISELETEDKSSLVAALNEVLGITGDIAEDVEALQLLTAILGTTGATRANSLIYEKNLGNSFTAEQSTDIRQGKFNLVRTGGYWTINGHKYWAAHADYRLHCGDTELTTHHMLVIPDAAMYNEKMNDTNVTTGGYYGSKMKTTGLAAALAQAKADFGADHILTHKMLLTNAVSNGAASGWAWYDSQIDLMSEAMVYGHNAWGAAHGYETGADKTQLALFQARPDLITTRAWYWLRNVYSAAYFCLVPADGPANAFSASASYGVRPAFLIY